MFQSSYMKKITVSNLSLANRIDSYLKYVLLVFTFYFLLFTFPEQAAFFSSLHSKDAGILLCITLGNHFRPGWKCIIQD